MVEQKVLHRVHLCEGNCGPRSDTMSQGSDTMSQGEKHAAPSISLSQRPRGALGGAQSEPIYKNDQTQSRLFPSDGGSPVTKSRAMWDQGHWGVDSGCKRPMGGWCVDFPRAQRGQAAMKVLVSRVIDGHQNRWRSRSRVREIPGWHANLAECPHCSTSEHMASGTNKVFGGALPRAVAKHCASCTCSSTC